MIDLRSDTVTVPTEGMRKAISEAMVGDDVFGEDPTTNELQEYTADLLGKEAALFVTSGTMGNQISIAAQTKPGDEVIVEAQSHIFYYETAGPAVISGVQLRCLGSERGIMNIDEISSAIRTEEYYLPVTRMVCIENSHNRHGGAVAPLEYIESIKKIIDKYNLKFHCDGARLWHSCVAEGLTPKEYAKLFDSVTVCLSKGLGSPVGSVLCGNRDFITSARRWRKILGGGMRQSGVLAAAGLYALKNHYELLQYDHENARTFAEIISESDSVGINMDSVETNMAVFSLSEWVNVDEFLNECRENGLLMFSVGKHSIRAVFHFQVNENEAITAGNIIKFVLNKMEKL